MGGYLLWRNVSQKEERNNKQKTTTTKQQKRGQKRERKEDQKTRGVGDWLWGKIAVWGYMWKNMLQVRQNVREGVGCGGICCHNVWVSCDGICCQNEGVSCDEIYAVRKQKGTESEGVDCHWGGICCQNEGISCDGICCQKAEWNWVRGGRLRWNVCCQEIWEADGVGCVYAARKKKDRMGWGDEIDAWNWSWRTIL